MYCHHLNRPVKVRLSRPESIRMHPKRHPMRLDYALGCDENGKFLLFNPEAERILGIGSTDASPGSWPRPRSSG